LSYEGVQYEKLTHNINEDQTAMYDTAAKIWQLAMKKIESALRETMSGANDKEITKAKGPKNSMFWGSNQRFWQLVMTSLQMPSVIQQMEKDLSAGRSIVVQLTNTNEAEQKRQLDKVRADENLELEDIDITPKEILVQIVQKAFETAKKEQFYDPSTRKTKWRVVTDSKGNVVNDPELVDEKQALIGEISALQLPGNPLDMILHHFGHANVSEVTGRQSRIVQKGGKTFEEKGLQK